MQTIQVNLAFKTETEQAKAGIQQLQQQLQQLTTAGANTPLGLTTQIKEATAAANNMHTVLNKAVNVNTGKLNLNKFQAELKRSGMTLESFAAHMKSLGPAGAQAFSQLALQINSANTRLLSLSASVKPLLNTFFSAAKYSLAYGAINAFTNSISSSVQYAKELDQALTDIRIVTGYSADTMASFTKQANKAAKALSTTTTEYAKASLIYFQQGLNGKEVTERANTTIKLANALGESAETVSDWMTAIWNNFDDGSKSLEYYADVLAKLGAATASSADEIAGGLEKFAGVAETIGLSYEYAASMLTTITAATRQSEEVVGTALKTILSRMEGLNLGETLEDGTTLNKYSAALMKIGVNINDANGQIKDMDIILNEVGSKWDYLNRNQQIALAQNVAGIRQYNQFVTLMDNWNTSMLKNVEMAKESEGSLDRQYESYEESLAAAQKRVAEQLNETKSILLGTDDMSKVYTFLEKFLGVTNDLLESFGGLPSIILAVVAALSKMYQPQLASFMASFATGISNSIKGFGAAVKGGATNAFTEYQRNATDMATKALQNTSVGSGGDVRTAAMQKQLEISSLLAQKGETLNEYAKQRFNWETQILQQESEQLAVMQAKLQKEEQELALISEQSEHTMKTSSSVGQMNAHGEIITETIKDVDNVSQSGNLDMDSRKNIATLLSSELTQMQSALKGAGVSIDTELSGKIERAEKEIEDFGTKSENKFSTLKSFVTDVVEEFQRLGNEAVKLAIDKDLTETLGQSQEKKFFKKEAMGMQNVTHAETLNTKMQQITSSEDFQNLTEEDQQTVQSYANQAEGLAVEKAALLENNQLLEKRKAALQENINKAEEGKKKLTQQMNSMDKSSKQYKAAEKQMTKFNKTIQSNKRRIEESDKTIKNNTNRLEKIKKATQAVAKQMTKFSNTVRKTKKTLDKNSDTYKEQKKTLEENSEAMQKNAKGQTLIGSALDGLKTKYQNLKDSISQASQATGGIFDRMAKGVSTVATIAMGFNMFTNAVSSLFESIGAGEISLSKIISSVSMLSFGILSLMPIITKVGGLFAAVFIKGAAKRISAAEAETIVRVWSLNTQAKALEKQGKIEDAEKLKSQARSLTEGLANVGVQFSEGPPAWPGAIASLAMLTALVGVGAAVAVPAIKQGQTEKKKENLNAKIETNKKNLELFDETQEEAESIKDLTEEYQRLKVAGESTYDTMKSLEEQIPNLIKKYEKLESTVQGLDLNTPELRAAYDYFKLTGDISTFEGLQNNLDSEIAEAELAENKQYAKNTAELAVLEGGGKNRNKGKAVGGNMELRVGTGGKNGKALSILEDKMGDQMSREGKIITFETGTPKDLVETYDKMAEALEAMKSAGYGETKTYNRVAEVYKNLSGHMEDVQVAQDEIATAAAADWNLGQSEEARAVNRTYDFDNMTQEQFEAQRENILKTLEEQYKITREQAEKLLLENEKTKGFEVALNLFQQDSKTVADIQQKGALSVQAVKDWYESLPEEDKTLFMGLDFAQIDNLEEAEKELEKLRDLAQQQKIIDEAKDLGYDENTLNAYTDILVDENRLLEKNNALSKQVALNNMRVNKGLKTLVDSWSEISSVIKSGKRSTLEYAEAIGKIQTAFEEAFEYAPNTTFVEAHFEEIEKLAYGDVEALQGLQDALAQEYVANLDYKTAITGDSLSGSEVQARLYEFLDQLDTSLEIGEDVEINQQFYDSLQEMINSGQLAAEDLQKMLRMKGFEMEITGWKKMKGPATTTYQHITTTDQQGNQTTETKTITTEEEIQVPIINGDDSKTTSGTAPSPSRITRAVTDSSINLSTLNKNTKKEHKKIEDEIERHHELTEQLEDLENAYNRISKARDRAFGPKKLALIEREKEILKDQIKVQKEYVEALEQDVNADWNNLAQYGASRDENGRLTNYTEMYKVNIDALNAAYDSTDEKRIKAAEEAYEQFKKDISQYEESLNTFEDEQDKLIDKNNELFDLDLEGISEKLEYHLGLVEDEIKVLEYELEQLDDPINDAADAIVNLGKQTEAAQKKVQFYRNALVESLAVNNEGVTLEALMSGELNNVDLTADQVEKLREYQEGLIEANQTLSEMGDAVHEKVVEAFEEMNSEMERQSEIVERNNSLLEHYRNVVDLVGKDALGISDEVISKISEAQAAGALNAVGVAKSTLDMNKKALADAEAEYARIQDDLSEEDKKRWEETLQTLTDKVGESEEALASSFEDALQTAADIFDKAVEDATKSFKDAMAGISESSEDMQRKFDQQKDVSSRYLADYQKIYELSKLSRELDASMDDTDSIRGKQRLRDLQEEILAMQESGAEVTQYEVDELRARYDLRLAEIALEEAQNAKSQVRMSRDAEGNWGYVYTADEKAVGQAEQAYEDKLYAYQNVTQKYIDEVESNLMAIPGEMADAIAELDRAAYASEEEYLGAINEIREFYAGKYEYYANNMNKALENSSVFYDNDWKAYSEKTGYKLSLDQNWRDQFNETTYSQVTGYQTADAALAAFNTNATSYLETLGAAYSTWYNTVKTAFDNSGISMNEYANTIVTKTGEIKTKNEEAANSATTMASKHSAAFEDIVKNAGAWSQEYSKKIQTYVDENNRLINSINGVIQKYEGLSTLQDETSKKGFNAENNEAKAPETTGGNDGNNAGTNKYYGTYYDLETGKMRRTTKTYSTEAEAKAGAKEEAKTYAKNLINEHQYKESTGQDGYYAGFSQARVEQLVEEKGYGSVDTKKAQGLITAMPVGNRDILEVKDRNGTTVYLSPGNYELTSSSQEGYFSLKTAMHDGKQMTYIIGREAFNKILNKWGGGASAYYSALGFKNNYRADAYADSSKNTYSDGMLHAINDTMLTSPQIFARKGDMVKMKYLWYDEEVAGWFNISDINFSNGLVPPDGYDYIAGLNRKGGGGGYVAYDDRFINSFDTGGYTGSWDSTGRLAMLHQKELVLNASDTENFLSAINILRDITSVIDLNAAAQYGHLKSAYSAAIAHPTQQIVEQEVTIHAEFPNATNHSEIEEAFNQLLNHASQFANRKN